MINETAASYFERVEFGITPDFPSLVLQLSENQDVHLLQPDTPITSAMHMPNLDSAFFSPMDSCNAMSLFNFTNMNDDNDHDQLDEPNSDIYPNKISSKNNSSSNIDAVTNFKSKNDGNQQLYDQVIQTIFDRLETYLLEIKSLMTDNYNYSVVCKQNLESDIFVEIVGMMKGLTDALCYVVNATSIYIDNCKPALMKSLFESKILTFWKTLLLRSPVDVRKACEQFLQDHTFEPFCDPKTALNGKWKDCFSDQGLWITLLNISTLYTVFT